MKNTLRAKLSSRALSMLVIMALMSFGVSASFASDSGTTFTNVVLEGSGTTEVPYEINDCQDLQSINEHPDLHYILTADVDCSGSSTFNGDTGFAPIANFTGSFDGRLHSISSLTISAERDSLGFFETVGADSAVQNIYLNGVHVTNTNTNTSGTLQTGLLAGSNAGSVTNISIGYSSITSQGTVGGLVGTNSGTLDRINNWNSAINEDGTQATFLGGIAGISTGSISNSKGAISISNLAIESTCGGLVGELQDGTVSTSYSVGQMECLHQSSGSVGGLVGTVTGSSSSIENSFTVVVPNHANYFDGTIVGNNEAGISLATTFFDAQYSDATPCDINGDTTCQGVNVGGLDPDYFKSNNTNAPLDSFDFASSWELYDSGYPEPKWSFTTTPLSPVTLNGTVTGNTIALSWNEPTNDTGLDFTGYQVSYTTDNGQTYTTFDTTERTASIDNLDPTLPYSIRVRARNVNGLGLPTYPYSLVAIPPVPEVPTIDGVHSRAMSLSWNDLSDKSDSYTIQYKKSSDSDWTTYTRSDYPTPSSVVYPLASETSYDFRVAATNERGMSEYSGVTSADTSALTSYTISSCQDLQDISNDPFGSYTLTGNIDCTESASWNDGEGFVPIGGFMQGIPFSGSLHGGGYEITNLYMNRLQQPAGLFMSIDGATIDNLTFNGGQIAGSRANDGTVYTDAVVNPIVGTLSALAANSEINNVHTNIDLPSSAIGGLNGGAGGLIGLTMPSVFGPGTDVTTMSITNSSNSGEVDGMVSGGLVGGSLMIDIIGLIGLAQTDGITTAQESFPYVGTGVTLSISDSQTSGDIGCIVVCGGFVGLSVGDLSLDNVTRSGTTGEIGASNPPVGPGLDDILAMLALSGPITGGLVGGSFPVSLDGGSASFNVADSSVSGSVLGTLASSIVGLSLPSLSVDLAQIVDGIPSGEEASVITQLVLSAITNVLSTDALHVENTDLSADVTCTVACGGVTTLSLGKTMLENVVMSGDITNDNTPLIEAGHPISFCPVQITGGLVGAQLLFPLDVVNSHATGDITVHQAGDAPQTQIIDLFTADFNDESFLLNLFCSLGSMAQGTGGIVGSFISPLQATGVFETILQMPLGTLNKMDLLIDGSTNTGSISSDAYSATGGLAGFIFGKSLVNNSSASGEVSNSTFAEMFRTPISSAATGGLIGRSLGGYQVSGNIIDVVMYFINHSGGDNPVTPEGMAEVYSEMDITPGYSEIVGSHASGNVVSSNSAGGLIGNVAGITKVQKSYAVGNVYGVAAGGLIGSGFNMGSPLGVLNLFSSIELDNTYARGNVYASSDPDTVTFAGGLVGMMAHFGEFKINHSYSTGAVGVTGGATNTRLVAGGLVGAELDMSILPTALLIAFNSEDVMPFILGSLNGLGLELKHGVTVENSFTTSSVPAHSSGNDLLIREIAEGNPSSYKTTGSLFGFMFSLDQEHFPVFPTPAEGESLTNDDIFNFVSQIRWNTTDDVVTNSYYDKTANNTTKCAYNVPSISQYFEQIFTAASDTENPITPEDIMSMLPKLVADSGTACTAVNADGSTPKYFKNNKTVAPLNSWSFNANDSDASGVWYAHGTDYPTFDPNPNDPVVPPVVDPPVTPNPNPTDDPFIPTTVPTAEDVQTITDQITDINPDDITEVLPNTIEKIDAEVTGNAEDELKPEDTSLIATVLGILSATGAWLLQHILEAILVILLGAGLTFIAKKKKVLDHLHKPQP